MDFRSVNICGRDSVRVHTWLLRLASSGQGTLFEADFSFSLSLVPWKGFDGGFLCEHDSSRRIDQAIQSDCSRRQP